MIRHNGACRGRGEATPWNPFLSSGSCSSAYTPSWPAGQAAIVPDPLLASRGRHNQGIDCGHGRHHKHGKVWQSWQVLLAQVQASRVVGCCACCALRQELPAVAQLCCPHEESGEQEA